MKGRSQFGSFLVIAGIAIVVGYFMLKPSGELRIFQPSDVNPALVDEDVRENEDHHILDFKLINQLGDTVTNSDVKGKILVVNFFLQDAQRYVLRLARIYQRPKSTFQTILQSIFSHIRSLRK